jgi:hypothetical protein
MFHLALFGEKKYDLGLFSQANLIITNEDIESGVIANHLQGGAAIHSLLKLRLGKLVFPRVSVDCFGLKASQRRRHPPTNNNITLLWCNNFLA